MDVINGVGAARRDAARRRGLIGLQMVSVGRGLSPIKYIYYMYINRSSYLHTCFVCVY